VNFVRPVSIDEVLRATPDDPATREVTRHHAPYGVWSADHDDIGTIGAQLPAETRTIGIDLNADNTGPIADLVHHDKGEGTSKTLIRFLSDDLESERAGYKPIAATLTVLYRHSLIHTDEMRVLITGAAFAPSASTRTSALNKHAPLCACAGRRRRRSREGGIVRDTWRKAVEILGARVAAVASTSGVARRSSTARRKINDLVPRLSPWRGDTCPA
jgi:hypothetical protein